MAVGRSSIIAGIAGLVIGGGAVALASGGVDTDGTDRARVEGIVKSYLLENPQIIPEAMEVLRNRDTANVVKANRTALEKPFAGAWAGAEDGDVVLVQFFDYACGFCRKSNPEIDRLIAEDKKLKVVWRELPVLGPDSQAAAELSLAAAKQGRFRQFHERLFEAGRPAPEAVAQVRQQLGVRPMPGDADAQAEMAKNFQLARSIGATGTPTFVVGDKVLQGAVGYDALKEAIGQARRRS
ncbi:MAG TPA: DsbA family protein [Allosphingosinicella sp.]|jgi:protein-disulfide isomerase